ncbi:type IV pilus twitching motility protein PilT [Thermodesulfovibrio sp.]|jgi:twitching motility protein PilT|uniref:type IV pilus twitching motility protein PilT n=1 Tax=Thermodesulfovibrio sp. TaxID=2067987 RepID=UPI0030B79615
MAKIDAFFKLMLENKASDLHLVAGSQPILRINGELVRIQYKELDNAELRKLLYEITPEEKIKIFEETGDLDFAHEIEGIARFRVNYFMHKHGIGAAFRHIPNEIKTIDQLGLPSVLKKFAMLRKGIILVTGPTGSGKSTTLASIIDHANTNRKERIITIEDPIEFVHPNKGCVISYREVGSHTASFAKALRAALREDPDIILVGEMRDMETIQLALEAAATGHLVFSTLHTSSAIKTVDRIIDVFPPEQQAQVRTSLSESLQAVVAQTLLKRADVKGRVAACEILINTYAVANLIREGKTHQILSIMQTSKKIGMQTMDDALIDLLQQGKITPEDAYERATDKQKFVKFLKEAPETIQ